ncbi:ribbon-helix-helix protein, CopG family [Brucella intermedia]|uniref:ribbon-helix-helix protein, CopG family n=1 Tax=Brucella intermedia TaxID=94625 RepID=UPI00224B5BDD|nr:ribbon-helix-helix protein, CopG family [Brucella intermedia]
MARPKGNRFPVRLSVSIEAADHAALSKLASDLDLSAAWLVRKAVAEFVERNCYDPQRELPLARGREYKSE